MSSNHCTSFRKLLFWLSRNRSIRLTSEGTRFILFTIAIGVAAINTGNNLFYLLFAMLLSLIVVSGVLSEQCLRRLEFRRHLPDLAFANQPATLTVSITNRKRHLPSFSLRILDMVDGGAVDRGLHLAQLSAQMSALLSYSIQPARRGSYRLEGIKVMTPFPFGLFLKGAFYFSESTLVICPELKPVPNAIMQDLALEGYEQPLPSRGQGNDLYNLRRYQPGDDSRAIHWMTTARTSQLFVRETEADDQRQMTILLSTLAPDSHDQIFEEAAMLTASLATLFQERGYALQALIGNEMIPLGSGEGQWLSILHALALCRRALPADRDPVTKTFRSYIDEHGLDDATIVVLPWPEPELCNLCQGRPRIIHMAEYMEASYVSGPGVPA